MKFYGLYNDLYEGVQERITALKEALLKFAIPFEFLQEKDLDFSNLPHIQKCDIIFPISDGIKYLENVLLINHPTTIYCQLPLYSQLDQNITNKIINSNTNLPQPKTIFNFTNNRTLLRNYVEFLGGFPLIIKSDKGSRGIGVIKIDSWQSLISTADYLIEMNHSFIMREYIEAKSGSRMIVLGNEVISAADFAFNNNDFRNAAVLNEVKYFSREYSNETKHIAINATLNCNLEFAGVDLLEDKNGNYYLLEVNFPTGFTGLKAINKIDVAEKIIEYLVFKSKNGIQQQLNGIKTTV